MISANTRLLLIRKRLYTAFIITVLGGAGSVVEAKIKCWKNSEGVRECGNFVPPAYAQQGHEEKSATGVTVESTGRAKSIEELQAEQTAAAKKAATALLVREQAAKDRVLLDTFSSEDDMLLARDGQLSHLKSQVKLTESHIEKLQNSLDKLIQKAADHERRGSKLPEKLIGDIDSLRKQIRDNGTFIETKHQERVDILEKFEANIARFRELKGQLN